ncbi:MAG TPA: universal stress protein [Solirubrobacteraceae bacterium]|jgi:nucleotide-binding universal stress UspA family protein
MTAGNSTGPALLCWDNSDGAERAIEHAGRILGDGHQAIVLFAHVPTESARGILGGLSGPDAPIMGVTDAENVLARGLAFAREAGFDAAGTLIAAERRTAEIITSMADEHDAIVIVMGQRQRSTIGKLLLGSTAQEVLNSDHRPVLMVSPGTPGAYPG